MPKIWLIVGGGFLGALLIAAGVVALTEREEPLTEGTPERTVQRFLIALQNEDFKLAHSLLTESQKEDCNVADLITRDRWDLEELGDSRVTLEDTKLLNGSAVVIANVTTIQESGPFGTSERSRRQTYSLIKEEGEWRLERSFWPSLGCVNEFPKPATPPREPERISTSVPAPTPTPSP